MPAKTKARSEYMETAGWWKMREPTGAEVEARFAEFRRTADSPLPPVDGPGGEGFRAWCADPVNWDPPATFNERCGDCFIEFTGPKDVPDEVLLFVAGAMSAAGMSDGAGVSLVVVDGKRGLYLEE